MTADANMMNGSYKSCAQAEVPMGPSESWFFFCALYSLCHTFWHFDSFVRHEDPDQNCICDDGWTTAGITDTLHFLQGTDQISNLLIFCQEVRCWTLGILPVPFDLSNTGPWCGIWCSTGTCSQYSCISDDECVAGLWSWHKLFGRSSVHRQS